MIDVKTCINDSQEKMDMAIMYLEEALAHIRAGKASTRLIGRNPCGFLRKYGTNQQRGSCNYAGCA